MMNAPPHSVSNERTRWFHALRDRLSLGWSAASLVLAGAWVIANRPDVLLVTQLWIVALGVGLFGVLHGGLDHLVGERVFELKLKRSWWAYFVVAYVGLAAAVMIGWWLVAPLMLVLFLLASALHFGLRDENHSQPKRSVLIRLGCICMLGSVPIIIPWLAFPQDVSLLFGWLAGTHAEAWQPALGITSAFDSMPQLAMLMVAVAVVLMVYWRSRRSSATFGWMEFLATVALFWTLPPLLAFAWYFCFLHSLRHLLTLAERLAPPQKWVALRWVAIQGMPLTLITLIASGIGYAWLRHVDLNEAEAVTRVIFWGLAALTFPHMLLTWLWERKERAGGATH
jgi:beta-carotene 15,15'-dioxygenase